MDPALLKQREAFLKRAAALPTVSSRPQAEKRSAADSHPKKEKSKKAKTAPSASVSKVKNATNFDYKTAKQSMANNFGNLAKLVDHMKKRHLEQHTWGLSLEEILEELQIFDLSNKTKQWLREVMPNNPRLSMNEENKYIYRPPFKIKSKNSLLSVLKRHDLDGKGGILLSELAECMPNAEKVVLSLGDAVSFLPTNVNKRKDKVVFYNDPESQVPMDEEFRALWRSVAVDHLDEKKVEEYLQKHGIESMKDLAPKKNTGAGQAPKRRAGSRRQKVHNTHLTESGVLKDYSVDKA